MIRQCFGCGKRIGEYDYVYRLIKEGQSLLEGEVIVKHARAFGSAANLCGPVREVDHLLTKREIKRVQRTEARLRA